jgi:type I restriction enzyme R subunit
MALEAAAAELIRDRRALGLEAASREMYSLLKDGVSVPADAGEGGSAGDGPTVRVRVIDWDHPAENDFLAVRQPAFAGDGCLRRPDIVGFVNGLPLVVLGLAPPTMPVQHVFETVMAIARHPQHGIPGLFWYNAFLVVSNGAASRVGSLSAVWEHFSPWPRSEREDEPRRASLETLLRGTCDRGRLLDLLENFTLFAGPAARPVKLLARNHQFLGVNRALDRLRAARAAGHGRGGVLWHAAGSGRTHAMIFLARKIQRRLPGNWTFVIVTERIELEDQVVQAFAACGATTEATSARAGNAAQLRELLRGSHRHVFIRLQKFATPELLSDRPDVVVLVDEAHRREYDPLAANLRLALPRALCVAFTGAAFTVGEERARAVFGDDVSRYPQAEAVADGTTVPVFYESRAAALALSNPPLTDEMYDALETAGLSGTQEDRLALVLGKPYQSLTHDERLEAVAEDIMRHFLARGFPGKALVVALDKPAALQLHDKVRRHWTRERKRVEQELARLAGSPRGRPDPEAARRLELAGRLAILERTDLALIVDPIPAEPDPLKKLGFDFGPHRRRMLESKPPLDQRFRDERDPLALVFVSRMWIAGLDVPSCSTVYLDRPMRNHPLRQLLARTNRVFPGKRCGLLVDYAGCFTPPENAFLRDATDPGAPPPIRPQTDLAEQLRTQLAEASEFCGSRGVSLPAIEQCASGGLARLDLVCQAVNTLIAPEPRRREFLARERDLQALFAALQPHPSAAEFTPRLGVLASIADAIRAKLDASRPDTSGVMDSIGSLLDETNSGETPAHSVQGLDLSRLDLTALAARFAVSNTRKIDAERLKAALGARFDQLFQAGRPRVDLQERFEAATATQEGGVASLDDFFGELLAIARAALAEDAQDAAGD